MSNKHMKTDSHSQYDHDCGEVAELLDAYSTNEIEGHERDSIELYLSSCRTCQNQLTDLQHFRELFTSLIANDHPCHDDTTTVAALSNRQSSRIADTVLQRIIKNEGVTMTQKPLSTPLQEHTPIDVLPTSPLRRRMWYRPISLLVAVLCIVLLAGSLLTVVSFIRQSSSNRSDAVPALSVWEVQSDQVSTQTTEEIFDIKYMVVTAQEIRFFYTFQARHYDIPQVKVYSYLPSNPNVVTDLAASVQSLGQLGTFNIGVIHAKSLSRAHQIIALDMLLPGKSTSSLQLTPLKQLRDDPHPTASTSSLLVQQTGHSEIEWYGPVMEKQVAFFKNTVSNNPAPNTSYIFVQLDDPITVKVITKAQYLTIAGQQNFF